MMLRMEEALSFGVTAATTTESTGTAKSMEKESTTGQMDLSMEENGRQMRCTALVSSYGQMAVSTRVSST